MTPQKVIRRLVHWAPSCFASMGLVRERCVLTTRVGLDVLARFDIAAEARSVVAAVSNRAYEEFRCFQATHPEASAVSAPPGAWAVIAGLQPEPGAAPRPKHWWGHLVVYVPGRELMLDLDFQQFGRDRLGMPVPPALLMPWGQGRPTAGWQLALAADRSKVLFVHYERQDENQAYVAAPDWDSGRPHIRAAVDALVRAIRKGGPS
ncbi:MAG: hypothetical protein EHM24_19700 [Acidobacteria bacterium]|nr:MAG: hypothetical protein EHM24_19700 [Acidobacteriota bacterium]